ncbi:hypothetical protein OAN96_00850 [Candidatus Gracilibacteria bacterium]|nr:hypothetical protein [Candidatus Gracilibacteria bacterium]
MKKIDKTGELNPDYGDDLFERISSTQKPCIKDPDSFVWDYGSVVMEDTGEVVGSVSPLNNYCKQCDFFVDCVKRHTDYALELHNNILQGEKVLFQIVKQAGAVFFKKNRIRLQDDEVANCLGALIYAMHEDIRLVVMSSYGNESNLAVRFHQVLNPYSQRIIFALEERFIF